METQMTEEQVKNAVLSGMLVFERMGIEGDVKQIWDPSKPVEVSLARDQFDKLTTKERYKAYKVNATGDQGEPMDSFDASAGRVILVPPMAGG